MRILCISDIHMSNRLPYAKPGPGGVTDRLQDQLDMWRRVHESVLENRVDATFVLGDLFDKSTVDAVTLTHTIGALADTPVPLYVLPGNHDAIDPVRGGRYTPEAFAEMGHARIRYLSGSPGDMLSHGDLRFWPVRYMDLEATRAALDAARDGMKRSRVKTEVLLLHCSILGCKHFGWTCDDGLEPSELTGWDMVLSGHFHEHQVFNDGAGMYLGAPMHHRFDDSGRKAGWWILDFSKRKPRRRFIDGGAPRFHEFEWPAVDDVHEGDYVRVKVVGTHAEYIAQRPSVLEWVARQRGRGVRADHKHVPVYHHDVRITGHSDMATLGLDSAVDAYVDSADVSTEGLDPKRLKAIGHRALAAVRA